MSGTAQRHMSRRFLTVTLLMWPLVGGAASAQGQYVALFPPNEPVLDQQVPGGAELVARRARVGRIEIQVAEVFEGTIGLAAPYRVANGLHVETRTRVVTQQLLFRSGELYNPDLVAETERLLRAQRYFNDATIVPVRYSDTDNTVDVLVRVHDVWTLSPGISFGRKGGENDTRLKFEDTNFLGLGKQISAARANDVDRTSWRLAYTDPQLLGTWWRLTAAYSTASDGGERALEIERPFYALDTRWSMSLGASDTTLTLSRYAQGKKVAAFDMRERKLAVGGGLSGGLQNGWARRIVGGFDYDAREFSLDARQPGGALPADRTYAYPWIGAELVEDRYVATRNLDQIGRTEDLHLGRSLRGRIGYAPTALGSTENALIVQADGELGLDLGAGQYAVNAASLKTRLENSSLANTLLDVHSRYYRRQSERRVFFASISGSLARNPDAQTQLLLGGDNGLRGYPLRYQAGTASALLTLEERFYTDWQPLKLVNVGAALFFDAGRTWGRDAYAAAPRGWLSDVGIGLRLGSARSGLGNVLHIDLAFPLDRAADIESVQLVIESRKSF